MKDKHTAQKIFWNNISEMIGGEYTKTTPRKINGVSMRAIKLPKLESARNAFRQYIGDDEWEFDELLGEEDFEDETDEEDE